MLNAMGVYSPTSEQTFKKEKKKKGELNTFYL